MTLIRKGPFARLFWANSLSSIGDWVTLFATLELAGDIGGLGGTLVALLARVIPGLLFGAIAGVVADRLDRKRTMIISDVGRALLVLLLPFVGDITSIFLISFAMEILSLIRQPAREATVPHLVPPGSLVTANSLSLVGSYGTMPVGALLLTLFGALVTLFDLTFDAVDPKLTMAFVFDSVTFLMSAAIVATIPIPKPEVPEARRAKGAFDLRAPIRDIVEGVQFVAGVRTIRGIIIGMTTALFGAGALFIVGDQFAQTLEGGGESGFGILLTAIGLGAGTGMVIMSTLSRVLTWRAVVFGVSLVVAGLATVFAATTSTIWAAAGWIFVGGVATGSAYVMGFTHIHESVSDELRGRTFAALFTLARTALLVSLTVAGGVAAALDGRFPPPFDSGVRDVLFIGGTIVILAGAMTLWTMRDLLTASGEDALREMGQQFLDDRRRARQERATVEAEEKDEEDR
ncbi:MAG: MFS transporter [Acidimicrobiia bacterium]